MQKISYARYRFPPVIIQHAVWLYFRFPLSYRDIEDLLAEHGIDVSYETVRRWAPKFAQAYARRLRTTRPRPNVRHLDEAFVSIVGKRMYLWRAVDHEGEVLEVFATRRRDCRAALKFLKRAMKRYGRPRSIVTDRHRSYRATMNVIGNAADQTVADGSTTEWNIRTSRSEDGTGRCRNFTTLRLCRRSRLNPQPLQSRPSSQQPLRLQEEPLCRTGRVASISCMKLALSVNSETGSH